MTKGVPLTTPAKKKNIGATIRIGQEIWCLPYAVFFLLICQKWNPDIKVEAS